MNRAKQFTEKFRQTVNMIYENSPKDLAICVYIYARDANDKSDDQIDGAISTEFFYKVSNYDKYRIKQDIGEVFNDN